MNGVARDEGGGDLAAGLAQAREAIRLEPDLALAYQVLSFGLAESGDYQGGLQAARAGGRAQRQRSRQPDGAGQGAGALRQLRRGGHQCGAGAPAAPDGAGLLSPTSTARRCTPPGGRTRREQVMDECLLDVPRERNCLRTLAVALVRLDRVAEARSRSWPGWSNSDPGLLRSRSSGGCVGSASCR